MSTPRPRRGALARPCPRCHAEPGHLCRSPNGRTTTLHHARRNPDRQPPTDGQRTGRNTRLTPELTNTLCTNLRLGAPLGLAALAAGIPNTTLYRWLAQADQEDPDNGPSPHWDFREAITQARAQGGMTQLVRINQAGQRHLRSEDPVVNPQTGQAVLGPDGQVLYKRVWEQDWRAPAFILERGFARDFGRRETVELAAGDSAEPVLALPGQPAGMAGAGVERLAASIAEFRARKELEAARERDVVEGEVVEEDGGA